MRSATLGADRPTERASSAVLVRASFSSRRRIFRSAASRSTFSFRTRFRKNSFVQENK
jgi:hypothetical protein